MNKFFILIGILSSLFAKAQNSEIIEPLLLPLAFEEPDGKFFQSDIEYEKSNSQRWVVYNTVEGLSSCKSASSIEVFKKIELNTPYWVVAEEGDFIRLYQFEKLVSFNGKMILSNHVDFDFGWVNKKYMLMWSKPINIKRRTQMVFKHNVKSGEPILYYVYKFDFENKRYLCSNNNLIIPNQEKEDKSLVWLDSNQVEAFNRYDFLDLNKYLESYLKFNEDSLLFLLSNSNSIDNSFYIQTSQKTIIDSITTFYTVMNLDTIQLTENEFNFKRTSNDTNILFVKYEVSSRDTFFTQNINPFVLSPESEEFSQRYLLMKPDINSTYFYFPNKFWKPNSNSSDCFSKLYLTNNNGDRFNLIKDNKSVFYTYEEFENLKRDFELFLNIKTEGKKFRKEFFVFLDDLFYKKVVTYSNDNSNNRLSKLILEITGIEPSSNILDIVINDVKDKDIVSDSRLLEIKQLLDSKFRAILDLESNNRFYINEGLNKFYFIPKSLISI
jgi:hypothetical protein